jgi:Rps23 Pro-64 3,4-dihydroxylase Tpa1-like proline 4-hydroxylase
MGYTAAMWRLGPAWQDEAALARAWRAAAPFPHLVIDDFADEAELPALLELLEEEPVVHQQSDLFSFDATAPEPTSAEVRALRDELAAVLGPPLSRMIGRPLGKVELRAYAYRPGDHLLPHTDHQQRLGRVLAYAYYLPSPEPPEGGELELFSCRLEGGEGERERDAVTDIASSKLIEPKGNRLVIFEVGDRSLHQVREVVSGMRISLAGWFYP